MKKLTIALAAMALALVSQAAQVNWTVTNSRLPTVADKTKEWSGASLTSDTAMAMTIQLLYAGELIATETTASAGNFMSKLAMSQDKTIALTTAAGSNTLTFDVLTQVVTDDGTYDYTGTISGNLGNVVSGSKNVNLTINMNNAGTWKFTPSASPTPTPTPEPTSGLLLVLGMAGLALRRRRA